MHEATRPRPDLQRYSASEFERGRHRAIEALWILVQALLVSSFVPGSWHRIAILRLFGAHIGEGVVMKPRVNVKFPWRLSIGAHSWIGEGVWIDNLASVSIGSNAVLSQDCYLCTGSHDHSRSSFALRVSPITIADGAWICARAIVAPGVTVNDGAVLALGSVATQSLDSWTIYVGNPAKPVRQRVLRED